MRICDIQYKCKRYNIAGNRPPNEHVRATVPCRGVITECECDTYLRIWDGEVIACELGKVRRIKGKEVYE